MPNNTSKKPLQPPFGVETVRIDTLDLDLRNSRFSRDAQSQDDALELMLTTAGTDCMALFRDITRSGMMSSSDLPIVVRKGGRYVVMEGNRRLTCLRIWTDIDSLSTNEEIDRSFRSRVERLVSDSAYAVPDEIRVAVAPSEEAADHWIERKHTGGAGGAGTVEWGAAMKDRRKARKDPAAASRAMAFIELVSAEFEDDPAVRVDLETVRSKRYTMIQRFVDRSVVRNRLGLEFADGKMRFAHGVEATKPIVRAVLHDFAQPKAESGKTWARELDNSADFDQYLDGYSMLLPGQPPTTNDTGFTPSPDVRTGNGDGGTSSGATTDPSGQPGSSTADATPDTRPPRPTPPVSYIFRGLVLDKFTNRTQEIVRQTSLLSIQQHFEVVSVLLRVILDLSTYQFLKSQHDHRKVSRQEPEVRDQEDRTDRLGRPRACRDHLSTE